MIATDSTPIPNLREQLSRKPIPLSIVYYSILYPASYKPAQSNRVGNQQKPKGTII